VLLWLSIHVTPKIEKEKVDWKTEETLSKAAKALTRDIPTYLLVPYLHNLHFFLLVIPVYQTSTKTDKRSFYKLYIFDSYGHSDSLPIIDPLKKWLGSLVSISGIRLQRVFTQTTGGGVQDHSDVLNCGVFTCLFTCLLVDTTDKGLPLQTFTKSYPHLKQGLKNEMPLWQYRAAILKVLLSQPTKQ
jgi:hypothetical protein